MSGYPPPEPRFREEVSLRKRRFHPNNYVDVVLTYDLDRGAFGTRHGWFPEPTRTWQGDTRVTVTSNYSGCSYVVTRRGRGAYSTDEENWMSVKTVSY